MLKRNFAVFLIAGFVLAGGAVAWSQSEPSGPVLLGQEAPPEGRREGSQQEGQQPRPDKAALREAIERCRSQAGIAEGQRPTAEQRQAVMECLRAAGFEKPAPLGHHRRHDGPGAILGRTVHGDLIVRDKDGEFQNVNYDRGTQKSRDGNTLVITRPDGVDVTVQLQSDTRYKGVEGPDGLQNGRPTVIVSTDDGKALMVGQGERHRPRPAGAPQDEPAPPAS